MIKIRSQNEWGNSAPSHMTMETLPTIIHTDVKEVTKITPWEVEAEI